MKKWLFRIYSVFVCIGVLLGTWFYRTESVWVKESVAGIVQREAEEPEDEMAPRIALTFDDGPSPVWTPELLDGLKERGVRASFFIIGENIQGNEELLLRIKNEGHLIGNHTWSHVQLTSLSEAAACEEMRKTSRMVKEVTGEEPQFMRPPFGTWQKKLERCFDMFPVLWSIDTRDWTTKNVEAIVARGTEKIEENDIILMHDGYESSVKAAFAIVDCLQEEGYQFVTVDELILE